MSFYASPAYLALVHDAFFPGRAARVRDVAFGPYVLRLLVVDEETLVTEVPFLDYHVPLKGDEHGPPVRMRGFARWVAKEIVPREAFSKDAFPGAEPAPFVDWSPFPTFADYLARVRASHKGLLSEQQRRRRRLAEDLGELVFTADDRADDVFPLARAWKQEQLRETGANDWLAVPANVRFLTLARERGLLVSSTLRAGGRLLSVWLGFIHDGVWSGWVLAYDHEPALARYSPGQQLIRSMLEESHARGHRELDFSIGGEDYKWMWATRARVLGSAGTPPLRERTVTLVKRETKRALARSPALLELIRRLAARRRTMRTEERTTPKTAATSPPEEPLQRSLLAHARARASARASALLMPVVRRAGRAYVGGDSVTDALSVARRLSSERLPSTLGFWDTAEYTATEVRDVYVDALEQLAESGLDTYLSIKPPALRFEPALIADVARAAHTWKLRVHCDSHGPEVADASHATEEALLATLSSERVSTTLPGRWLRSLADADWAVERGLRARVVKGQWPDPAAPMRDQRDGFLAVVERLAGRARAVGLATHDVPLIERAVACLRSKGTQFELELLYGMPMDAPLRWARANGVSTRVYVPFGKGFLPSAVGVLRRNPRLAWLVLKELVSPRA